LAKEKVKGDKPETTTTSNKTEVNIMNNEAKNIRQKDENDAVSKAVVIALATILVVTLCAAMVVLLSNMPGPQSISPEEKDHIGAMFRWTGALIAVFVALFGILIGGVFVFMALRIDRGAKLEARNQAREILDKYRTNLEMIDNKYDKKLRDIGDDIEKAFHYDRAFSILAWQRLDEREKQFF